MRTLVWLRSDLRLGDNPALAAAVERSPGGCVALFVATPKQWLEHDWGPAKADFVLRSAADVAESLGRKGIPFLWRRVDDFAAVPDVVSAVAGETGCDAVHWNRELEFNEARRDDRVRDRLSEAALEVRTFEDQTVIPPAEIRTANGDVYSVYTPFRRRWTKQIEADGLPEPLPEPEAHEPPSGVAADDVPDVLPEFAGRRGLVDLWPAGEAEAARRLARFLADRAEAYADARDLAADDGTSRLSPYLATGAISLRVCLAAAVAANRGRLEGGEPGIETWISELVWREFYRHVLVGFPRVSMNRPFRAETETVEWAADDDHFRAWCEGRTGVPFVDAGMRQLLETGWMHNRLRMVTAMFLAKDLLIDWRRGERHFMRHLVDGDLANNNGGWQWAASTGTDAAPYFRIFNPWTQGRRFDPEGRFIRRFVPELGEEKAADLHDADKLGARIEAGLDYPRPIVDHAAARERAIAAFKRARRD